jgi:predicted aldo/keto reductase-like oxidoreductase
MEYRKLGKTGLEVGVIGLGTEHLERKRETLDEVLRLGVEAGVNYVDLLYVEAEYWEGFGSVYRSYRDKLVVAPHWGSGPCHELEFSRNCFESILSHLGNDYAEIGLMTMAIESKKTWNGWAQEAIEHLQRYKEEGRIGAIGTSGHNAQIAIKAVESGQIDVLMFGINMLNHDEAEIDALCQACVAHGIGLVAMKPYHGGTLLSVGGTPSVDGAPSGITAAQCLEYVFSRPVSAAVPGPKTVSEWQATLRYLEATDEERDYRSVVENLRGYLEGQCTYCDHCLPCPEGIAIGWMIWLVDRAQGGVTDEMRGWYSEHRVKASACVECGDCLDRCPFGVDIIAKMQEATALFEVA